MYAGPVGWFGGGESEFAVGIRSALVDQVSYTIFLFTHLVCIGLDYQEIFNIVLNDSCVLHPILF